MERIDFTINIGLVGNSDVGKTCLIRKYTDPQNFKLPSKKISTIGVDQVVLKLKINDYLARIIIWDPAGQERFQSMTNSFYKGLDGVLLVFDVTNEGTCQNLTKWLNQINEIKPCPYFIMGNKADLSHERMIEEGDIQKLEKAFNSKCFLTSAFTGENVDEAFNTLINVVAPQKIAELGG